ncbi:MAG: cadmium-translocating P-type ATPase [Symploca sp. SIO2E9]|nr:cadmium-translocating P-type ATPase [Symploca sp. SIO2E9]
MVTALELPPRSKQPRVISQQKLQPQQSQSVKGLGLGITYSVVHTTPGRIRLRVPRLVCDANYAQRLQSLLAEEPSVTSVQIKPSAMSVAINYKNQEVSDRQMLSHLANLIQLAPLLICAASSASPDKPESDSSWFGLKFPLLATILTVLAGPFGLPIPAALIGGTVAAASAPVAKRAVASIWKQQRLNIDCLDLMAVALTAAQGNLMTPSLLLMLHELGDGIRDRTARTSANQSLNLLDSLSQYVWVERNGSKEQVAIDQIEPGEIVIVYPGEQIPVDGKILRGKASIDEQKLTGESVPVVREAGQQVYASTLVREGQLYILTERTGDNTRAGQSIQLVKNAPVYDTRMENYAAQLADKAILPALLLAGSVLATTGSLARAASILTLDFMTGIRVSVPTSVLASLTAAARRGILIRSGRALEQLAEVEVLVFDKTGTLTQGDVVMVGVTTISEEVSSTRVLALAAAAEQRLTHPVAAAVVNYARQQRVPELIRSEWDYKVGLGVQADIDGERVLVGSARFLGKQGISLEYLYEQHPELRGSSLIYVASNGKLLGVIEYTDPPRPESQKVIKALQNQGIEIHMLTGDNRRRAAAVAKQLDIPEDKTHAEAFPEQKAAVVRQLHESGKIVAFVGDGINDSAALAYADVSVSFGDGSDIARETADVVLMENDLSSLLEAVAIAKQTQEIIKQNTQLSVIPNVAALSLATTVGLHPLAATAVHNGSAIAAGVNGLRPLWNYPTLPL